MTSAKDQYRKVLVTGGAGFIGSHIVDALMSDARIERVVVIDNFDENYDLKLKEQNVRLHKKNPKYRLVRGDIRDFKKLYKIFKDEKFDAVMHLAAKCNARAAVEDPYPYIDTNIVGTFNLLECAKDFSIKKFVLASTSSVYGNGNKAPFKESMHTDRALTAYGASKKAIEQLAYTYHHNFGLSVVCLRIFNAYGERMRPDLVLPKWVRAIESGKEIELSGKGTRKRDYTYVGDVADAFMRALHAQIGYDVINIGSSKPFALMQLLKIVEQTLKKKAVVIEVPSHTGSVEMTHANTEKAQKVLGWAPRTVLTEGVSKYIAWLAAHSK